MSVWRSGTTMTWVCKSERTGGSSETQGTEQVGLGAGLWEEGPWNGVSAGKEGERQPWERPREPRLGLGSAVWTPHPCALLGGAWGPDTGRVLLPRTA